MKVFFSLALLLAGVAQAQLEPKPFQFFYVPLPEGDVFTQTFKTIHSTQSRAPMYSTTALAVSTDDTVIWYDHWEDGYEESIGNPQNATTRVWGDGDASNGCEPGTSPCTDANDKLTAGQSIILESRIPIPRIKSDIKYDGGDYLAASFPIAITRAQYPENPGSLLAGGVEVLDMSNWGTEYKSPLGTDLTSSAFRGSTEYVAIYFQAGNAGSVLTLDDGTAVPLGRGETHIVSRVKVGDTITASNPVQAYLLSGDVESTYEMRWYSLLDHRQWTNEYISPVGDTTGQARIIAYNPNSFTVTVRYEYRSNGSLTTGTIVLGANKANIAQYYIPNNSGARVYTDNPNHKIFALSNTDTVGSGQLYDWGFPLVPSNRLSTQVLIGWGYGCTNNSCTGRHRNSRSLVFVTPVEDATLYVDYNNDGVVDETVAAARLTSKRFSDSDNDMTGALIYAKNTAGDYVNIAAAWGQFGANSYSNDGSAQDLGTLVVPFNAVEASSSPEVVGGGFCQGGKQLEFTVRVVNVGPTDVPANQVEVIQNLPNDSTYVGGSTRYIDASGTTAVPDNAGAFPLIGGKKNLRMIPKRGGTADFKFRVTYTSNDGKPVISSGVMKNIVSMDIPFEASIECVTGFSATLPPPTIRGGCPGSVA